MLILDAEIQPQEDGTSTRYSESLDQCPTW